MAKSILFIFAWCINLHSRGLFFKILGKQHYFYEDFLEQRAEYKTLARIRSNHCSFVAFRSVVLCTVPC